MAVDKEMVFSALKERVVALQQGEQSAKQLYGEMSTALAQVETEKAKPFTQANLENSSLLNALAHMLVIVDKARSSDDPSFARHFLEMIDIDTFDEVLDFADAYLPREDFIDLHAALVDLVYDTQEGGQYADIGTTRKKALDAVMKDALDTLSRVVSSPLLLGTQRATTYYKLDTFSTELDSDPSRSYHDHTFYIMCGALSEEYLPKVLEIYNDALNYAQGNAEDYVSDEGFVESSKAESLDLLISILQAIFVQLQLAPKADRSLQLKTILEQLLTPEALKALDAHAKERFSEPNAPISLKEWQDIIGFLQNANKPIILDDSPVLNIEGKSPEQVEQEVKRLAGAVSRQAALDAEAEFKEKPAFTPLRFLYITYKLLGHYEKSITLEEFIEHGIGNYLSEKQPEFSEWYGDWDILNKRGEKSLKDRIQPDVDNMIRTTLRAGKAPTDFWGKWKDKCQKERKVTAAVNQALPCYSTLLKSADDEPKPDAAESMP